MKNLKNLGKVLGKKEQKSINGGTIHYGQWIHDSFGDNFNKQCDSSTECPNAVDRFTGNYCQGYCFLYATGSRCQVDPC